MAPTTPPREKRTEANLKQADDALRSCMGGKRAFCLVIPEENGQLQIFTGGAPLQVIALALGAATQSMTNQAMEELGQMLSIAVEENKRLSARLPPTDTA